MIKGILRKMVLMKVVLERSWPTRTIAVVPAQTGSIPSCVTLNSKTKMFELHLLFGAYAAAHDSPRPRCWKKITFDLLVQVCIFFWSLSKPAQDTLLWSVQARERACRVGTKSDSDSTDGDSSPDRQSRTSWFVADIQVCRRAFVRMLGIGQSRLQRTKSRFQGKDERWLRGKGLTIFFGLSVC